MAPDEWCNGNTPLGDSGSNPDSSLFIFYARKGGKVMDVTMLLMLVLGGVIGFCIGKAFTLTHGVLRIDTKNPEKDLYRMEFHIPLYKIPKKKLVKFKVDADADLS